jgi:ERCC4-type nuclease
MVSWCCDNRERELLKQLPNAIIRQLPVGDIWIGLSGEEVGPGGIVAERKTAADLEASILDGRYQEQRLRLLTYCQQTGARPLYIIEGTLDRIQGRFTEEVLRKFLTRLQLRYGVPVMQTDSVAGTAALCATLRDQIAADSTVFVPQDATQKAYASTVSVNKRANREDPEAFASTVLQSCPGVSSAVAAAILKGCGGTLAAVWTATEEELAAITITEKRKVGPAVAKRLVFLLHGGV